MVQQPLSSASSHASSPTSLPYLQHEPYLRRVALALTQGDASEADDLLQDTWLVALHQGPDRPESTRPWLVQVLRNRFLQGLRGTLRRSDREALVARPDVDSSDPAQLVAEGQVASALRGALHRLPETYALPLRLRFYEGLPPRHIASRMGMPVETVRTRLKRGLAGLRHDLCEDGTPRRRGTPLAALAAFGRPARHGLVAAPLAPAWLSLTAAAALVGLGIWLAQALLSGSTSAPLALVQLEEPQPFARQQAGALTRTPAAPDTRNPGLETPAPPIQWTIRVNDEQGRPLEGAEVFTRDTRTGHAVLSRGTTGAGGVLEAELGPGPHYLAAKHIASGRRTRTLWASANDAQAELVAWPAKGFEFQVVGPDRKLLPDATVCLEPAQGSWWGKWDGAGSLQGEAWWLGTNPLEPGRFEVFAEPRRQWRLRVQAPGYADWLSGKFDMRRELPKTAMMGAPARITGMVSHAGQPAGGVVIEARDSVDGSVLGGTHTSGDGAFVLEDLPRGQLLVVAQAGPHSAMHIVGTERAQELPCELELSSATSVTGQLRDGDGAPLAGRRVQLARVASMTRSAHPGLQDAHGFETRTDTSGAFAFGGISAGEHRILVYDAQDQVPVAARMAVFAGGDPLEVCVQRRAQALGSIELRIPCGDGGEVWLSEPTLHVGAVARVDAEGIARLEHLLPGLYEVALWRGQEPIDLGNVPLRAGQSLKTAPLGAPPRGALRVSLPSTGMERGDGDLTKPVRIRARSSGEARVLPVVERYVRRCALGRGVDLHIPAGEVMVEAVWGDLRFESRGSAIAGGRVDLELSPVDSRHVRLRLTKPADLPGKGPVSVEVFDADGHSRGTRHHARQRLSDAQVSVFELPSGEYRAVCMRGGAIHHQVTFQVTPGADQLEINLRQP